MHASSKLPSKITPPPTRDTPEAACAQGRHLTPSPRETSGDLQCSSAALSLGPDSLQAAVRGADLLDQLRGEGLSLDAPEAATLSRRATPRQQIGFDTSRSYALMHHEGN